MFIFPFIILLVAVLLGVHKVYLGRLLPHDVKVKTFESSSLSGTLSMYGGVRIDFEDRSMTGLAELLQRINETHRKK